MKRLLPLLALYVLSLSAQVLISPLDAMHEIYGTNTLISKKNILLSKSKALKIQQSAKVKLETKIYRIYTAKLKNTILGYGILINKKVRSKNAVVLYFISNNELLDIEIIAFNEPLEYLPTRTWQKQFQHIATTKRLQLKRSIPTITGATLSARTVTDGSRLAFALYNELLKEK